MITRQSKNQIDLRMSWMEDPFKDTNIIREGGTEEPRLRRMENPSFSVILFFHCAASAPSLPSSYISFLAPMVRDAAMVRVFCLSAMKSPLQTKFRGWLTLHILK